MRVGWLLVVILGAGCHKEAASQDHPPDAQLGPHFVRVEPYYVPLHGAKVTATYSETLREDEYLGVDILSGTVTTSVGATRIDDTHLTFDIPAAVDAPGPIELSLRRNFDAPESRTPNAAKYIETPAEPHLAPTLFTSTLWFPLHPELDRPCARAAWFQLANDGDEAFTVTGATAPAGFSIDVSMCAGLRGFGSCQVRACFSSTTPGAVSGMLTIETTAGSVSNAISATVLPLANGLDATFRGTGAVSPSASFYRGTAIDGGLALWGTGLGLERMDTDGVEHAIAVSTTVNGFQANRVFGFAATNGGMYLVVGDDSSGLYSTLMHFDATGTRDATFGQVDLPITDYYVALARQSTGRLLAMSRSTIVAYTASGAADPSYGNAGQREIGDGFRGVYAVDGQDRLYLVLGGTSIIRFTAAGNLDETFAYSGTIRAIAVDGASRLHVATSTGIVRLDETGGATIVVPNLDALDLAITDKLYVVSSAGAASRYTLDGTLESTIGFSSASQVTCGASGCWISGLETGSSMGSSANERYVLKLAP